MVRRLLGLSAAILLASCQVQGTPTSPVQVPLAVQITPALEWMKPAMAACAEKDPSLSMTVQIMAQNEQSLKKADLLLRWTDQPSLSGQTFALGKDRLVFIVHPDNPIESIERSQLAGIYSGMITDWSTFPGITSGSIQPWVYPANDDTQLLFATEVIRLDDITGMANIASSPFFVMEAVGEDVQAIGMVPSRWLDSQVKPVSITGYANETWELPILAVTHEEPAEASLDWLSCVEESILP